MVFAKSAGWSLAGFLPDETSTRCFSAIRQRSGVRQNRRCSRSRADGVKKATVRSVRTRRPGRSSRGGTAGKIVQEFRNSRDGNERAECRVDSVIHSTSPSRRENARRAIRSPVFKASLPPPNIRLFSAAPPRTSVCRLQHVHELHVPNRCIAGKHLIPFVRSALAT
jgi:hypothetical protein